MKIEPNQPVVPLLLCNYSEQELRGWFFIGWFTKEAKCRNIICA